MNDLLHESEELSERLKGRVTALEQGDSDAKQAWWTTDSAMTMCSVVLCFGLLVIGAAAFLAARRLDQAAVLKLITIPMAAVLAVFLVVAGYSDSQIAPAIGLLGTIVGYVLGTSRDGGTGKSQGEAQSNASSGAGSDVG